MASSDLFVVYIRSSHDLNFTVVASYEDTISSLKKKAEAGHIALFPDNGRIVSQSLKIWREGIAYNLSDEIPVRSLFDVDRANKGILLLYMDAVPVTEVVPYAVPVTEVVPYAVPMTNKEKKRHRRPKKNVVMVPDELCRSRKSGLMWHCPYKAMANNKYCTRCKSISSKRNRKKLSVDLCRRMAASG